MESNDESHCTISMLELYIQGQPWSLDNLFCLFDILNIENVEIYSEVSSIPCLQPDMKNIINSMCICEILVALQQPSWVEMLAEIRSLGGGG